MSNQTEKGQWPSATIPSGWSWLDFKSAWTDCTDSKKKVKQREYHDVGALPVVDQGEGLIGGHTNDLSMKNSVELPCIIFGDHTRAVKFVDFEFAQGADGVKVLKPGSQFDPQFAFQAMRCIELPNKGYSRHFKFLKSSVFPVPPLPEQRRIAAKLDRLSERSANARDHLTRVTTLAARAKQAVLSAAVSGNLTKDWRKARSDHSKWRQCTLGEVASGFNYGSAAKSAKEGEVPVLRMGNIQDGMLDWEDLVFTSDPDEIAKYRLKDGDVIFNRTNSPALVGKTSVFRSERPAIFAGYLIRVECGPDLEPEFLNACLNSGIGREYCWRVKTDGVSQSNINAKKLKAFPFELPGIEEQQEIIRRIETVFAHIERLTKEACSAGHLLDRLDARLLAKAFQGKLVPQDPDDEPAEALLERIREAKAAAPKPKRARRKKTA